MHQWVILLQISPEKTIVQDKNYRYEQTVIKKKLQIIHAYFIKTLITLTTVSKIDRL